ncbi:Hypp8112 [Branchiostoma lanceolatum]|uniref:Hypp8112 protein n=1 Tax=Branchiostoma lanceolatum TaxID=7740 RepID=A0A8K0ECX1_BRALA|nr:Hypp8112 [Branchiostoma lanceolatum]
MKLLFGMCLLLVALRVGCARNVWDHQVQGFHLLVERVKAALQKEALEVLSNIDLKWHEVIWSNVNMSQQCQEDVLKFREDLVHGKKYALHMLDASGKPPSGILTGNLKWPGSYSQCVEVTKERHDITFNGKYFMASLVLSEQTNQTNINLKLGLCVPSSCTENDVILQIENNLFFWSMVKWRVVKVTAFLPEVAPIGPGTITAIVICAALCILQLIGTLYDVMIERPRKAAKILEANAKGATSRKVIPEQEGIVRRLVLSFSIYNNLSKLLSTKQPSDSITCLHGIRFLSLTWIILGHTYNYSFESIDNPLALLETIKTFMFQVVLQTMLPVDTFFFLSGLLMTYLLLKRLEEALEEGQSVNFWMLYVHRYLRLTPALLFVIMMTTWVIPQLFMGPMWHSRMTSDLDACRANWWTNVLYINNIVHTDHVCLGWTWYLANDMQFFIIGVPIVYILYRCFYAGLAIKLLLRIANFGATAVVVAKYHIRADFFLAEIQEGRKKPDVRYTEYYIKPWVRIGPYLIGMFVGWVLYKTRGMRASDRCDGKMVLWLVSFGWCSAIASALAVVFGLYGVYNGAVLSYSVNMFFIAIHRSVWAMALGWMVVACYHGYGGVVNTVLSWTFWMPLSRLTYSAYLIHPIVMFVTYHTAESTLHLSTLNVIHYFLGHMMLSYGLAVLVFVTVESPTMNLLKITAGNSDTSNNRRPSDYNRLP